MVPDTSCIFADSVNPGQRERGTGAEWPAGTTDVTMWVWEPFGY